MTDKEAKKDIPAAEDERPAALRAALSAAAVFALLLALLLGGRAAVGGLRIRRVEAALDRRDAAAATRIASRIGDAELRGEYLNRCRLLEGELLMEEGDYSAAAAVFSSLGSEGEADGLRREALYRLAMRELESGEYDSAAQRFASIAPYADAEELEKRAEYLSADAAEAAGDVYAAFEGFRRLEDYSDARSRALDLAERICGERDVEAAWNAVQSLSPEEVEHRASLARRRAELPQGVVAVGFYHTLALRGDGSVLACGDDSFGQCGVGEWRGVRMICAGAYHSVALMEDGTVAAVGRNSEGQCEVGGWSGVVAVAAADYATFGLKADGTLLWCGYNDYYMLPGWTDIRAISGGSYAVIGLRGSGDALVSHRSARSEELRGLVDAAVCTGCAVGLRPDGSVFCTAGGTEDWRDIVDVSASSNAVIGLRADGRVEALFFRSGAALDLSSVTDAVAAAPGGTHYAFVLSDGRVVVFGENEHGECETEDWKLW